jgi:hypothetical protein
MMKYKPTITIPTLPITIGSDRIELFQTTGIPSLPGACAWSFGRQLAAHFSVQVCCMNAMVTSQAGMKKLYHPAWESDIKSPWLLILLPHHLRLQQSQVE